MEVHSIIRNNRAKSLTFSSERDIMTNTNIQITRAARHRRGFMGVQLRLGIMMFLQYAIWGSWFSVLSAYMINDLHFTGVQAGIIYSLLPFATIIAPFIGGQAADRWFPTERVIAFLQFTGGAVLILASRATDYPLLMGTMLLWSLLYAPTLALTNSMAFINLRNSEKEFGRIRVFGSFGWIAAGLGLSGWRIAAERMGVGPIAGDTLLMGGVISILMGFQCLTLPKTPPRRESVNPWAFLEAFKMLRNRDFAVFMIIAFVVSTELYFYYLLTAPFLMSEKIGVPASGVSGVMVLAQVAEILVMAVLLPWFLPRYGIRRTLLLGILAWPIRYIIFAVGAPAWLVIASLVLHGFCYVFFFTASFIYVDLVAPRDIRASAQALIALVTLGVGNFVGSLFAGWVQTVFTVEGRTNWTGVFLVPCGITILCLAAFLLLFREAKPAAVEA
jgi:nucleoside transporter